MAGIREAIKRLEESVEELKRRLETPPPAPADAKKKDTKK